jgi:hypothetical protein
MFSNITVVNADVIEMRGTCIKSDMAVCLVKSSNFSGVKQDIIILAAGWLRRNNLQKRLTSAALRWGARRCSDEAWGVIKMKWSAIVALLVYEGETFVTTM